MDFFGSLAFYLASDLGQEWRRNGMFMPIFVAEHPANAVGYITPPLPPIHLFLVNAASRCSTI